MLAKRTKKIRKLQYFHCRKASQNTADESRNYDSKLQELLTEKNSVLTNAAEIMRKNQELFQKEMRLLINQTVEIMDQIDTIIRKSEMAERTQWLSAHILMMFTEFQGIQRILLEIIVNQQQKLHPLWIDLEKLNQQINSIEAHSVESGLQLMGKTTEKKIINIYRFAKTFVSYTMSQIVLTIELTLVGIEYWESYAIWPVPMNVNNKVFIIKSNAKVIATNTEHTKYALLSQSTQVSEVEAIFNVNNSTMHCEADLFFNQNKKINKCKFTAAVESEWRRKLNNNMWLYHSMNEITAKIKLENSEQKITINGSGIIILREGSKLHTNLVELRSENKDFTTNNLKLHEFSRMSLEEGGFKSINNEYVQEFLSKSELLLTNSGTRPLELEYADNEKYIVVAGFIIGFTVISIIIVDVYIKMKIRFITIETM